MSDDYYIEVDGEPRSASWDEYLAWAKDPDAKRVAQDTIGESWISTVFLCIDHNYGDGPPVLYETLVFDGPLADEGERYTSRAAALAGHARMVERARMAEHVRFRGVED